MNTDQIAEIAHHQHLRQVEVADIRTEGQHVRIRIEAASAAIRRDDAQGCENPPASDDRVRSSTVFVKSVALGIFRRSHPSRLGVVINVGASVEEGQPLALLQLGETFTLVTAPATGAIVGVHAQEGQRVDYGMPLFTMDVVEN